MKYDAYRIPLSRAETAHTMSKIHAIGSPGSLYRTVMNRKCDCVPLMKRNDFWPRLHARTLLREHKLAACKVPLRLG